MQEPRKDPLHVGDVSLGPLPRMSEAAKCPTETSASLESSSVDAIAGANAALSEADAAPIAIPNHELLRRLGKGGFGEVWLGRNTLTRHFRAVKLITRRSVVELRGLQRLTQRVPNHPHLLPIEDVGIVDDCLYCLMPLADGAASGSQVLDTALYEPMTLSTHLERSGRLAPAEVAALGAGVGEALTHLHAHGVTHGDVKPQNILRWNGRWCLADYGLADDLRQPTHHGFTRGYSPSEGAGSAPADQYALGVVLLQCLTGWRFTRESLRQHADQKAKRLREVRNSAEPLSGALAAVIERAANEAPEQRFPSLADLAAALQLNDGPPEQRTIGLPAHRPYRWIVVAGLTALSIGAWLWYPREQPEFTQPTSTAVAGDGSLSVACFRSAAPDDENAEVRALGLLGRSEVGVRHRDFLRISAVLPRPMYYYLIAVNTDGSVQHLWPDAAPQTAVSAIEYPAESGKYFSLTEGPGVEAIVLIGSDRPLPPIADWQRRLPVVSVVGSKRTHFVVSGWPFGGLSGAWLADAAGIRPIGSGTRGEVVQRNRAPRPLAELLTAIGRNQDDTMFKVLAFEVQPRTPQ